MNNNKQVLEISWSSYIRLFVIIGIIAAVIFFRQIIFIFAVALVFASILEMPIRWLNNQGVHRIIGTLFMYLSVMIVLALAVYAMVPSLIASIGKLSNMIPGWFEQLNLGQFLSQYGLTNITSSGDWLSTITQNFAQIGNELMTAFKIVGKFFGSLVSVFFTLLIAFYINVDKGGIERFIRFITPVAYENYALSLWARWQKKISGWFYSQLVISGITGFIIALGLIFLNVKFALLIGLLAALLDFIPYVGAIFTTAAAALLASEGGFIAMGLAIILCFGAHQLEHLFSPSIRGRIIKLSPILIILGIIIGGKIFGVLGIVLAIPFLALASEFLKDLKYGKIVPFSEEQKLL